MGDGQKRRQECGTERGDIKVGVLVTGIKGTNWGMGKREGRNMAQVGVLVMGIKGTKWEKDNREGRNVAQGEGTLRWVF